MPKCKTSSFRSAKVAQIFGVAAYEARGTFVLTAGHFCARERLGEYSSYTSRVFAFEQVELRTSLHQRLAMRPSSPPPNIQEEATQAILQQIVRCVAVPRPKPLFIFACVTAWLSMLPKRILVALRRYAKVTLSLWHVPYIICCLRQEAIRRGDSRGVQLITRVEKELEAVTDMVKDNISDVPLECTARTGLLRGH